MGDVLRIVAPTLPIFIQINPPDVVKRFVQSLLGVLTLQAPARIPVPRATMRLYLVECAPNVIYHVSLAMDLMTIAACLAQVSDTFTESNVY